MNDVIALEKIGPLGVEIPKPIRSNGKKVCLWCGVAIKPTNDSGWEMFTQDGVTTQPICNDCHNKEDVYDKADVLPES